ncbi:MAG: hypothetical protein AVDCRST_MAG77-1926, partial [uncultured Chloroflexi bacterium]
VRSGTRGRVRDWAAAAYRQVPKRGRTWQNVAAGDRRTSSSYLV